MRLNKVLSKLILPGSVLLCFQPALAQNINFTLGSRGLNSLTYGTTQVLTTTAKADIANISAPVFKRAAGTTYSGNSAATNVVLNATSNTITATYAWGVLTCNYEKVDTNRLDIRFFIHNTTADTLTSLEGCLAGIATSAMPEILTGADAKWIYSRESGVQTMSGTITGNASSLETGPGVTLFGLGSSCCVAVSNLSDALRPIYWKASGSSSELTLRWFSGARIAPNKKDTCIVELAFGSSGPTHTKLKALGSRGFMNYAGCRPGNYWPDRRPIGAHFMSSTGGTATANNPGQWFRNDPTINTTTPAGLENFRTRVCAEANTLVGSMRRTNSQGVITWDIEGGRYQNIMYPGDPDMIDGLAPEMNYKGAHSTAICDTFFQIIRDAGFKSGVCIRPQKVTLTNGKASNKEVNDPEQETFEDVDYAYKRWGTRLFYEDSNVDELRRPEIIIPASILYRKALAAHPDVLIAGEWQTFNYYQLSTVYESYHFPPGNTPPSIRNTYPAAFSVLNWTPNDNTNYPISALTSWSQTGDILMANSWYDDPGLTQLATIFSNQGNRPFAQITNITNGAVLPQTFTINATAGDTGVGGAIILVDFLSAGIKVGSSKTAPYSFTWTNAPVGKHQLWARVIDNRGNFGFSEPVCIRVDAVAPPQSVKFQSRLQQPTGRATISVFRLDGRKVYSQGKLTRISDVSRMSLPAGIYVVKVKEENGTIQTQKIISGGVKIRPY